MWAEVVGLFSGDGLIPVIIMLMGLLLLFVEIFVPGFGIFGITGIIFSVIGIVVRAILGASIEQIMIMIGFSTAAVVLAFVLLVVLIRAGILNKSAFVQSRTSVPLDYAKSDKGLLKLVGKMGFAVTSFEPMGKFVYESETYEALTHGEYIEKGSKVKITEVVSNKIYVKKV